MNKHTFVPNPVIALDCPACDGTILVDQLDLGGKITCDGCLVAFALDEPAVARTNRSRRTHMAAIAA